MFPNLSLEFLDSYTIPRDSFQDTVVGGLSAITYDRDRDLYYVLSDDRSKKSPARFYTLKLDIQTTESGEIKVKNTNIEKKQMLLLFSC